VLAVTVPPMRDAGLQDVGAEQLAAVQLVGVVGVEQDQRVQVAVAGVEHVGAAQRYFFSICWIASRMSARRLRGMVESMHM
jgi:hypothetical protein